MTQPIGPEQWMVDMYVDNVLHELQQSESILEHSVLSGSMGGKKKRYKYLGKVEMNEVTTRKGDTNWIEFDFWNRWVYARTFNLPWLEDRDELEKQLTDPQSDLVKAAVSAAKRRKDRSIIEAFDATAYAGEDEALTAITFPTAQIIDIQLGGSGTNTGINLEKIKQAKYFMDDAEVLKYDRFFGITALQIKELLDVTEVTNADYSNVKALEQGEVSTLLGFTMLDTQLFPLDTDNQIRSNFAWQKDCMQTAISREVSVKTAVVPTKNFQMGTYVEMRLGAVRLYDEGVVKVPCKEVPRT